MVSACVTPLSPMRARTPGRSARSSGKSRWQWESTSIAHFTGRAPATLGLPVHPVARERQLRGPGLALLRGEELVDRDPALLEGVGTPREVEPPDAGGSLARGCHGAREAALEVAAPEPERARIVRAQRFHVVDLESLLAHVVHHAMQVRELALRKHVAPDELARPQAHGAVLRVRRGDAVVEEKPALAQEAPGHAEVAGEVAQAHVLEHADAGDLVVERLARMVAVVLEQHAAPVLQARRADALGGEAKLVFRERDAGRV